jgi:hypothetical protein
VTPKGDAEGPANLKIESRLLRAIEQSRGGRQPQLDTDDVNRVLVDIRGDVTTDLVAAIARLGGVVVSQFQQFGSIRARLSLDAVLALAQQPDVRSIRIAEQPVVQ